MFTPVSSAGIEIDEQHGLVDCGPRRLDPEADWFHRALKAACPLTPVQQPNPAEPPEPVEYAPACDNN